MQRLYHAKLRLSMQYSHKLIDRCPSTYHPVKGRGAQHSAPRCIPPVICTRNQHPRIDPDKQILRIKLGQLQVLSTSIVATGIGKPV